jgi:hypothetical protein
MARGQNASTGRTARSEARAFGNRTDVTTGNTRIGGELDTQRRSGQLLSVGSGRNAIEVPSLNRGADVFTDVGGALRVRNSLRQLDKDIKNFLEKNPETPTQLVNSLRQRQEQAKDLARFVNRQVVLSGTPTTQGAYAVPKVIAEMVNADIYERASFVSTALDRNRGNRA